MGLQLRHLLKPGPIGVDHAQLVEITARTSEDKPTHVFFGRLRSRREGWQSRGQSSVRDALI